MEFIRVADVAAVPPGASATVRVGRYEIALFNVNGTVYALENACPHQGGPIAEGWVEGLTVTCPWHAWCFDLRTGNLTLGDFAFVPRFDVRIEQDGIYLSSEPIPR
ncbi:MAG TPA: Rieske 2Fe-2S domain-containing protein [Candidatus Baltobacteraceae bacterium]|nr:Rieske 2Fe-2S domain-containing protein [Candidatus Baltobacteraceae bacterium]